MKENLLALKISILQSFADFIILKLGFNSCEYEFNFWMTQGLILDTLCVNNEIYLN